MLRLDKATAVMICSLTFTLTTSVRAAPYTLESTLPRFSATQYYNTTGDTLLGEDCQLPDPAQPAGLKYHHLYGWPSTGGPGFRYATHLVIGMEGLVDTFHVETDAASWLFWDTAEDLAGNESCPGPTVRLGIATGVDLDPMTSDPVVSRRTYNVRGQIVDPDRAASGVYLEAVIHASGKLERRKRVKFEGGWLR